jgi:glycerophosphoryl diester phosphodiesterase
MIDRIAHRGANKEAPENTMAAFSAAFESGATHIECDIRLTADDVPIIIHDATLDRTTNGSGQVDQCSYKTVQTLDAGSWFGDEFKGVTVPRLEELLKWQKQYGVTLHLEIKPMSTDTLSAGVDIILEQVHKLADTEKIYLLSFQYDILMRLQELKNRLPTVFSIDHFCESQDIKDADDANCKQINIKYDHICFKNIQDIHQAGLRVGIYAINNDEQIEQLTQSNVDAIYIDDMHMINSNRLSFTP